MTDYRNWDNHALRHECLKLSAELEQVNKKIESLVTKELEAVKLELETLKACYKVDILLYENKRMQEDVAREIKGCKELIDDIESLGIFKSGEEHAGT